jgi:hypothetical protein
MWPRFGFRRTAIIRSNVMAVTRQSAQNNDASLLQTWRTPVGPIESGPPTIEGRIADQCGWPLLAFASEQSARRRVDRRASELIDSRNGWPFGSVVDPIMGMSIQRQLPMKPIYPGFAINTIFYAAILWLPFAAFGVIRRRRRIKRGLCVPCGYDLRGRGNSGGGTCPECGAAIPMPDSRKPTAESPQ